MTHSNPGEHNQRDHGVPSRSSNTQSSNRKKASNWYNKRQFKSSDEPVDDPSYNRKQRMPVRTRKQYDKQHWHGQQNFKQTEKIKQIQILYILAVVDWIVVIFALKFYDTNLIGIVILLIPFFVFGINFGSVAYHSVEIEDFVFKGNFLSFGFLIVVIIINWSKVGDKSKLFKILLISLVLIMLSLIDIWVKKDKILLAKHFRTIFQTLALVLLVFALYSYYLDQVSQHAFDDNGNTTQETNEAGGTQDERFNRVARTFVGH